MKSAAKTVVLIPHFNNPQGLKISLLTIREEIALDILIVDDGSDMNIINEDILLRDLPYNLNLDFIYLKKNSGIEEALNQGLRYILDKDYNYIARLDCGDLCAADRFTIQQRFMENDPELELTGSYAHFIDTEGHLLYDLKPPTSYPLIRHKMHVNAMFIHPTVMFTTRVVRKVGLYPTTYQAAEDFAFFFKIIKQFKAENIPLFLVSCEVNTGGISLTRRKEQLNSRFKILKEEFYWGFYPCYGLVRNFIISKLPYALIYRLKRIIK